MWSLGTKVAVQFSVSLIYRAGEKLPLTRDVKWGLNEYAHTYNVRYRHCCI